MKLNVVAPLLSLDPNSSDNVKGKVSVDPKEALNTNPSI